VGELKGGHGPRGFTVELLDHLEDVVVDLLVCLAGNVEEAIDPGLAYV
jgi:hypothetical protein